MFPTCIKTLDQKLDFLDQLSSRYDEGRGNPLLTEKPVIIKKIPINSPEFLVVRQKYQDQKTASRNSRDGSRQAVKLDELVKYFEENTVDHVFWVRNKLQSF